jgi:nucleotide-binding universal stress UspA family protein
MFGRILVPLDGTPESNAAVPVARTLARATGGSIILLRVLPDSDLPGDRIEWSATAQTLEQLADALATDGLHAQTVIHCGEPYAEILQEIRLQSADLVIMRTHGRVGLDRAIMGSVASRVLSHSDVPAVLVRPNQRAMHDLRTLLVPVDGSPGAALALSSAVTLAKRTCAAIHLLDIAVPISLEAWAGYGGMMYYDPSWDQESLNGAQTYVAGMVRRLGELGLTVSGDVRMSSRVAATIGDAADEHAADLIVMSSHRRAGLPRALLGSVADAVARTSRCPVLLTHRPDGSSVPD